MYYYIMMTFMTLLCLIAVAWKIKREYSYIKEVAGYDDEYYFDRQIEIHDKNAEIFNDMYSMDDLLHQFLQDDKMYFMNFNSPIESLKRLRTELDAALTAAEISNRKAREWEEEARAMKEESDYFQEENSLLRKGTEFTYQKTVSPFVCGDNQLINYDGYTWLIHNKEKGGIVGYITITGDAKQQDKDITLIMYRRTMKSPPNDEVWELKGNKGKEKDHVPVRIDNIKKLSDLMSGLRNIDGFQTYGLSYPSAMDYLNDKIQFMQERGKKYDEHINKIQKMQIRG